VTDAVGPTRLVFKILRDAEWEDAVAASTYGGSALDHEDGFIHLSTVDQVCETAARYFAGQADLVLVAFHEGSLGDVKWEASRGGDLFPHVYGAIPTAAAEWVKPLPLADGVHVFPPQTFS
jgi:uncharacterized protein (DUF952 family)